MQKERRTPRGVDDFGRRPTGDEMSSPYKQPDANEGYIHEFPGWVEQAFALYARGQRNWSELGRLFNVDRRTVKKHVIRFARMMETAAADEVLDARREALVSLEQVLSEAWRGWTKAITAKQNVTLPDGRTTEVETPQHTAAVGYLKLALDAIERRAALRGVATRKTTAEVTGAIGLERNVDEAINSNPEAKRLFDRLMEQIIDSELESDSTGEEA